MCVCAVFFKVGGGCLSLFYSKPPDMIRPYDINTYIYIYIYTQRNPAISTPRYVEDPRRLASGDSSFNRYLYLHGYQCLYRYLYLYLHLASISYSSLTIDLKISFSIDVLNRFLKRLQNRFSGRFKIRS